MTKTTDYGSANTDLGSIKLTTEAHCQCHPDRPNMWCAYGTDDAGNKVAVYWEFSDEETESAGEDAGSLPWDDEHVIKAEYQ